MNLGVLIPEFPGQTHSFFLREIRALRDAGHTVRTLSTRPPPESERSRSDDSESESKRCVYLGEPGRLIGASPGGAVSSLVNAGRLGKVLGRASASERVALAKLLLPAAALVQVARREGIEHVHVHSAANAALVATLAKLLGGPGYSLTLHTRIDAFGGMQDLKWEHASFGLLVAEALRDGLLEEVGYPELVPPLTVAPMGIDPSAFRVTDEEREARWRRTAGDPFRVVTCGRLHVGKGHSDLIEAVAMLRGRSVETSLEIIGEGPDRPRLEAVIGDLGLGERVTLLGRLEQHEIRDRLASAHAYALASHNEAIGVATMEAMAAELPVVVTDVGGVGELVRHETNGLMVSPERPGLVADMLGRLAEGPEFARRLAEAGHETVIEGFTSEARARRLMGALEARGASEPISSHA
ncbi:MAG: glycosyltransferase family 4 protein [Planctomycetota bacterium]